MFDNLRKQGSSMIVWVLFGILIAGFVISFGPQSVGSSQGCQSSSRATYLTVDGRGIDDSAWRFAYGLARGGDGERAREMTALAQLVRRELLAGEAERRGLRVPDGLVDHVIVAGELHYGGRVIPAKGAFYDEEGKGIFNYNQFKRWVFQRMNLSVAGYKRQQTRELLASTMDRILRGSVPVSIEEARAAWEAENTTVGYDALTFDSKKYADALKLTDADLDRYVAAHEAEVKAGYVETAWKGKKQVRVRRVFVASTPLPPPPDAPPGSPVVPTPPPAVDPAKAKLEAARAAIVAGKKTLAAVAAELDADAAFRAKGGDWGWYDVAALTLPDPALNDAVKAQAGKGEVSAVIAATDGFYLISVVDRREGDLTFAQVARDLAEPLARKAWGQEAARRAATLALETAKATKKSLKELFPETKTGAGAWSSSVDVPTAWMAQAGGSGSATGSGSAAPPPAADPKPPAAAAAAGSLANDVLPEQGPVTPQVSSLPPLARQGISTMVGKSGPLAKALYEDLAAGALGPEVYAVDTGAKDAPPNYVVVQVTVKNLPDVKQFEKDASKLVGELAETRGEQFVRTWLERKCKALVGKNAITPRQELLTVTDPATGKLAVMHWDPCAAL